MCSDELKKCMSGEYYNCHDRIFLDFKTYTAKLLKEYNALAYDEKEKKQELLKLLFGEINRGVGWIPFTVIMDEISI